MLLIAMFLLSNVAYAEENPSGFAESVKASAQMPADGLSRQTRSAAVVAPNNRLKIPIGARPANWQQMTDTQLTALIEQWPRLSPAARRDLLAEVSLRMKRGSKNEDANVGPIVDQSSVTSSQASERRYGRVTQGADGSVRVETQVIRVSPNGRQVMQSTQISRVRANPNAASNAVGNAVASIENAEPETIHETGADGAVSSSGIAVQQDAEQIQIRTGASSSGRLTGQARTRVRFGVGFENRRRVGRAISVQPGASTAQATQQTDPKAAKASAKSPD